MNMKHWQAVNQVNVALDNVQACKTEMRSCQACALSGYGINNKPVIATEAKL